MVYLSRSFVIVLSRCFYFPSSLGTIDYSNPQMFSELPMSSKEADGLANVFPGKRIRQGTINFYTHRLNFTLPNSWLLYYEYPLLFSFIWSSVSIIIYFSLTRLFYLPSFADDLLTYYQQNLLLVIAPLLRHFLYASRHSDSSFPYFVRYWFF